MDDGLRAKLLLAMGNSYGIRGSAIFDKNKAIKYTDQAIELANYGDRRLNGKKEGSEV